MKGCVAVEVSLYLTLYCAVHRTPSTGAVLSQHPTNCGDHAADSGISAEQGGPSAPILSPSARLQFQYVKPDVGHGR